jgi:hypothetical protein
MWTSVVFWWYLSRASPFLYHCNDHRIPSPSVETTYVLTRTSSASSTLDKGSLAGEVVADLLSWIKSALHSTS